MIGGKVKSFFSYVTFLQQHCLTDSFGQKNRVKQGNEDNYYEK